MYQLAQLLPLVVLLAGAAVVDFRSRRIPNVLCAVVVITGLASSLFPGAWIAPWQSLAGIGVGFAIGVVLFALGALTGGDVKLLAGIGAWLGTMRLLEVMAGAAIVGLVFVLVQSIRQGKLMTVLRSSAVLSVSLFNADASTAHSVVQTDRRNFAERTLPYSFVVLLGLLLVTVVLP